MAMVTRALMLYWAESKMQGWVQKGRGEWGRETGKQPLPGLTLLYFPNPASLTSLAYI